MQSISKSNKNHQIDSPRVLFSPRRSGRRRDGLGHFEFARAACLCLSLRGAAARIRCGFLSSCSFSCDSFFVFPKVVLLLCATPFYHNLLNTSHSSGVLMLTLRRGCRSRSRPRPRPRPRSRSRYCSRSRSASPFSRLPMVNNHILLFWVWTTLARVLPVGSLSPSSPL